MNANTAALNAAHEIARQWYTENVLTPLLLLLSTTTLFAKTADLDQRLAAAVRDSMGYKVVLDDVLGEGPGAWDNDPRWPAQTVNCMIWLQLVLARAYAPTEAEAPAVLDRLRYYGGEPAFALRKHYIDHWLKLEPAPLRPVPLQKCGFPHFERVTLTPERFTASKGFACPLYRMHEKTFELAYVARDGLERCTRSLAPGHYVAFAVPSAQYARQYLGASGPMGQVHSLVIESAGGAAEPIVYHASTTAGHVLRESLTKYLARMHKLHRGYSLYQLDPEWQPLPKPLATPEQRALVQCEGALKSSASR